MAKVTKEMRLSQRIRRIESGMKCGKRAVQVEILRGRDAGAIVEARVCLDPQSPTGASVTFANPFSRTELVETLPFGRRWDRYAWATTPRRERTGWM